MVEQFEPWYFGVAFAFLFKYCTGMPDMPEWSEKQRYRRSENAPRVELADWVRIMARRVEAQLSRDWHFGFASWNLLFRSSINTTRTLYSYAIPVSEDGAPKRAMSAQELEAGAIEVCKALYKTYQVNGKKSL